MLGCDLGDDCVYVFDDEFQYKVGILTINEYVDFNFREHDEIKQRFLESRHYIEIDPYL